MSLLGCLHVNNEIIDYNFFSSLQVYKVSHHLSVGDFGMLGAARPQAWNYKEAIASIAPGLGLGAPFKSFP